MPQNYGHALSALGKEFQATMEYLEKRFRFIFQVSKTRFNCKIVGECVCLCGCAESKSITTVQSALGLP